MKPESHGKSFIKIVSERVWRSLKTVALRRKPGEMSSPQGTQQQLVRSCCPLIPNFSPTYVYYVGGTHTHTHQCQHSNMDQTRETNAIVQQPLASMANRALPLRPFELPQSISYQEVQPPLPRQLSSPQLPTPPPLPPPASPPPLLPPASPPPPTERQSQAPILTATYSEATDSTVPESYTH